MFNNVDRPFRKGETIKTTLTFEKPGDIEVGLVVGNIAGPLDDDKDGMAARRARGRVLLKQWPHGCRVQMLGGDAFESPSGYEGVGLSPREAERLSRRVIDAEAKLDGKTLQPFGSFDGIVTLSEDESASGHSVHEGHGQ